MPSQPAARQLPRPDFADVPDARRRNLAAIRDKDTKPELVVRRLLHAAGYRYRVHVRDLPGRPDLVFSARRKVIEIRGCFWHLHGCANSVLSKTRVEWWTAKLEGNAARDARNVAALESAGWRVQVVWECQIRRSAEDVRKMLVDFLGKTGSHG